MGPSSARTPATSPRSSSDATYDVAYYRAPDGTAPARDFLAGVPPRVAARVVAVVQAVAAAPPHRFSGGGYWEAMHGEMTGWFEIRVDGPPRGTHYRVFCLLDTGAQGTDRPLLVLVDGRAKARRTTLDGAQYAAVRAAGDDYRARQPRPLA